MEDHKTECPECGTIYDTRIYLTCPQCAELLDEILEDMFNEIDS